MDLKSIAYAHAAPYPAVEVSRSNHQYARAMLSNIGACNSEMSAVSLYFYNSLILRQAHPDAAEIFHKISVVEMHHLDIFGRLAHLLGADPRLWSSVHGRRTYWSPGCNRYPRDIVPLLENAIKGENEAVNKYRRQMQWVEDPHLVALLGRIIMDEEKHLEIFHALLSELR